MGRQSNQRRVFLKTSVCAAAGIAFSVKAEEDASSYPSRPIRIVVPFPAGQGADTSARVLARALQAQAGQSVIVENRPGGNNTIGVKAVTTSPADGYTLFYGTNSPMAANGVFFRDLGYDPVEDFAPVAMFGRSPWVVVVSADSPFMTFQDLVEHSKSNPQAVTFASGATGYMLAGILLADAAGMTMNNVPYKGSPQAIQDVVGQQVTMTMSDVGTMRPLIEAGRVRPLLAFDNTRIAGLPDVPCLKDFGLEVPILFSWTSLFAKAGTPPVLIDKLAGWVKAAVESDQYVEFAAKQGSEIRFAGPAELGAFQKRQVEDYRLAMKVGNVEPQ
jgi:tripartite-type tricarboxylate transporter receptor subunit TctC